MDRLLLSIVSLLAFGGASSTAGAQPGSNVAQTPQTVDQRPGSVLTAQSAMYSIFVRGAAVGNETVSVERTDNGWVISGSGRFEAPINLTLRQAEVRYGLDLKPQRLRLLGTFGDQILDLTTIFEGTKARNTYLENDETKQSEVAVSEDAVILPSNFFGAYTVLAARLAQSTPGAEIRVYAAPQGELPLVLNEVIVERVQTASRTFAVRRHKITLRGAGAPLEMEIETEDDGKLVRVTVPAVQVQVAREDVASVAARQQRFSRDGDEDVRILANGFNIAGTLSRPKMAALPAGKKVPRLPAILLVSGLGTGDRDEFVAGIPLFGQLAGGLADAGYLVVRYDKRGVGQSGGRPEAATLADYSEDAAAIVKWLADRDDVDSKSITIIGHGEGAWVALLGASRTKQIDRVVMVGAGGSPGAELVLEQQQITLTKAPLSEEEKQKRVELQRKIHAALLSRGSWDGVPEEIRRQADTPWFASVLAFDPAQVMRRLRQPVLIVAGERDREVPAHHAEKLAALARARKKDPGTTVLLVPEINHLLLPATTGEIDEYLSLRDRHVSSALVEGIANWIARK